MPNAWILKDDVDGLVGPVDTTISVETLIEIIHYKRWNYACTVFLQLDKSNIVFIYSAT